MSPEALPTTTTPTRSADKIQDDELSNMLDMVPDVNKNETESDDKYVLFTLAV